MKMLLDSAQTRPASASTTSCAASSRARRRSRLRPPRLQDRGSARDAPAADVARLGKRAGSTAWFDMSQRIEALVKARRS
jgi:hypothetical protein